MQANLPVSTAASEARSQKSIQPTKINENCKSSETINKQIGSNNAVLSPQASASKQNFTPSKILHSNHSYLRDFLKQHSNKSQQDFNLTERAKIG